MTYTVSSGALNSAQPNSAPLVVWVAGVKSPIDTKDDYFPASNGRSYMLSRNYKLSDNSATYTNTFCLNAK